jgi:hypothetical protein
MPIITPILNCFPNRQYDRLSKFFTASLPVARDIIKERQNDMNLEDRTDKDVLSVLREYFWCRKLYYVDPIQRTVRANREENPGKRMSDDELISQLWYNKYPSLLVSWPYSHDAVFKALLSLPVMRQRQALCRGFFTT